MGAAGIILLLFSVPYLVSSRARAAMQRTVLGPPLPTDRIRASWARATNVNAAACFAMGLFGTSTLFWPHPTGWRAAVQGVAAIITLGILAVDVVVMLAGRPRFLLPSQLRNPVDDAPSGRPGPDQMRVTSSDASAITNGGRVHVPPGVGGRRVVLMFVREVKWQDRLRAYTILIDGEKVGRLRAGRELSVAVSPGSHSCQATIDWTGSPPTPVTVEGGERVVIQVQPAGGAVVGRLGTRDGWLNLAVQHASGQ